MGRTVNKELLDQKIKKLEQAISKNRIQYDKLTAELEELHKKQKMVRTEEILKAMSESKRSYEEIIEFIHGGNDSDE